MRFSSLAFRTFTRLVQRVRQAPGSGALSRKVVRCVQGRLYEKIPVQRIAKDLHVNVSYLCTQFKRETGHTISDYVQEAKTEEAKLLLEDTALRTLEISELLCFSSVNYYPRLPGTHEHHAGKVPPKGPGGHQARARRKRKDPAAGGNPAAGPEGCGAIS